MTQRAHDSIRTRVGGWSNVVRHFAIDKGVNQYFGERWLEKKQKLARKRASRALSAAGFPRLSCANLPKARYLGHTKVLRRDRSQR